jgi:hypothetical protein
MTLQIDNHIVAVEKSWQCKLVCHERMRNVGVGLTIQIVPISNGTPLAVPIRAEELLLDWITKMFKDEQLKLSTYWKNWADTNIFPHGATVEFNKTAACSVEDCRELSSGKPQSCNSHRDMCRPTYLDPAAAGLISFRNPEEEWESYAMTFGATEFDRVLMEEQVKIEKKMRMVLDVEVSLMFPTPFWSAPNDLRAEGVEVIIS